MGKNIGRPVIIRKGIVLMKLWRLLFCATLLIVLSRPLLADDAAQLQSLMDKTSPSIVTVKLVMKASTGQGGDRENKVDMPGVVVDKDGLVMISNMMFSFSRLSSMLGRGSGDTNEMKIYPTDVKILFAQDDKEYPAYLVATDSKLDLAFVKIESLGDKKITPIDFSGGATGSVGEQIVSINRLHKGFDYAPYFQLSRISGLVSKPKKAYLTEGGVEGLGLPIFTMAGDPLGVLTTLESGVKDEELVQGITFHAFLHQYVGGSSGVLHTFIVPCQTVYGVIGQAKIKAAEVAADRAKNPPKKAGTNAKPPASTKPPGTFK